MGKMLNSTVLFGLCMFTALTSARAFQASPTGGEAQAAPSPPILPKNRKTAPSRIVLDTLARIQSDALADKENAAKFQQLADRCNATISRLQEQIALDESRARRKHDELKFDVARITDAVAAVTTLENQFESVKRASARANRTLADLRSIRSLQVSYFNSHSEFLTETQGMLTELHKYLDAPPGHLSRKNVPSAGISLSQLSENIMRRRRRLRRFKHSATALVRQGLGSDNESPVSAKIHPAPHIFHQTFHSSLQELNELLGNATSEYRSDKDGASNYFQAAFDTLHKEAQLQHGKVIKLQNKLDEARAKHRRAVLVMEHVKESPSDTARKFLMKNAAAALKATENQCDFLRRAQVDRQEHWEKDRKAAGLTQNLVQRLTDDIATRISGTQ